MNILKRTTALILVCCGPFLAFSQNIIQIGEIAPPNVKYSDVFSDFNIVRLETNNSSLISVVSSIKTDDERIFIFDDRQSNILIFNSKGAYISKIADKGKGPGEMVLPKDFSLDRNRKHIEVLDGPGQKINVYTYDGKYLHSHPAPAVSDFEKVNSTTFLGYSQNYSFVLNNKLIKSELGAFDKKGKLVKEYKNIRSVPRGVRMETYSNLFSDNNGEVYLVPLFENYLFKIDSNLNINKTIAFKFETKIPKNILDKSSTLDSAIKEYDKQDCPYFIKGLNMVNSRLSFQFYYRREVYYFFCNSSEDQGITVKRKNFSNDLALVPPHGFRGSFEKGLIDIVHPTSLIEEYQALEQTNIIKNSEDLTKIVKLIADTKPTDNPILFFYIYKQNEEN